MSLVSLLMHWNLAYQLFLNSSIQLFYQSLQVLGPLFPLLLPSLPLLLLQFLNDHHLLLALLVLRELLVLLLIILAPFEFFIRRLPVQLQAFLIIILLLLKLLPLFKCILRFHQQLESLSILFLTLLFLLLHFCQILFFSNGVIFSNGLSVYKSNSAAAATAAAWFISGVFATYIFAFLLGYGCWIYYYCSYYYY